MKSREVWRGGSPSKKTLVNEIAPIRAQGKTARAVGGAAIPLAITAEGADYRWRRGCCQLRGVFRTQYVERRNWLVEPFEGQIPDMLRLYQTLDRRADRLADQDLPGAGLAA